MGTDNLFHKRKARSKRQLERRAAKREAYAKVLVVCEGQKTEPFYFADLRNHFRLHTANVEICGDCESDPGSVVRFAQQRYREERDTGDGFDKVYCVFDKDAHHSYSEALSMIASAKPRDTFTAINSVPCFEYWLLLHFIYSTKPYVASPGNSAGSQIITDLKQYLPNYLKGTKGLFTQLLSSLEFAKNGAERSLVAANSASTDNPTTHVHKLVNFLQNIKTSS